LRKISSANISSAMMDMNTNYSFVNMTDYQSAQALTARALEIFSLELKPIAPKNDIMYFQLGNG
jgi:hypothetical protein